MDFSKTVDLSVGDFPAESSPTDIARAIVECYPDHDTLRVASVQQCPKKVARVTFDKPVGRTDLLDRGELVAGGIKCKVVCPPVPPPPPTPWTTVVVYNFPYEFSNDLVSTVLSGYGVVRSVRYQSLVGLPGVSTATRLVRMRRKRRIPRFLFIGNFRCKVWYKGQPIVCDICDTDGHTAATCPDKGKCRLCHQPGHMARACHKICHRCKGNHPVVNCPRNAWGHTYIYIDFIFSRILE